MKKICKILILCVFLFIVFVSCTSATTIRVEPVKAQKTFALEHELLELCGGDSEFSYTKYLGHRLASDWENLAEWEEYLKESKCFYADMRYSQKEINSVQEAIAVFSDLKQTMNVPSNWVIFGISYVELIYLELKSFNILVWNFSNSIGLALYAPPLFLYASIRLSNVYAFLKEVTILSINSALSGSVSLILSL